MNLGLPSLGPGARVDVRLGETTLLCRACRMRGLALHLAVPDSGRQAAGRCPMGTRVPLTLYRAGVCWDFEATVHAWIEGRPLLLTLVQLTGWSERQRRRTPRAAGTAEVDLELPSGVRVHGRTLDVSERGLAVLAAEPETLAVGMQLALTVHLSEEERRGPISVRLVWRESWIHTGGRSVRVGATLAGEATPEQARLWRLCVDRIAQPEEVG